MDIYSIFLSRSSDWAGVFLILIFFTFVALVCFVIYSYMHIDYESARDSILYQMALQSVTVGMDREDIYTQQGKVRVVVDRRTRKKIDEIQNLFYQEEKQLKSNLESMGLISSMGKIKKADIPAIAKVYNEHLNTKISQKLREIGSDWLPVADFWDVKNKAKGDAVGVYIIYNKSKNKYYVGQATRLLFRLNQHFTGAGNGDVYADYKYGDSFYLKVIKLAKSGYEDLDRLERDMIAKYHAYDSGYNKTAGNG